MTAVPEEQGLCAFLLWATSPTGKSGMLNLFFCRFQALSLLHMIVQAAEEVVANCSCASLSGCPACIHSATCMESAVLSCSPGRSVLHGMM